MKYIEKGLLNSEYNITNLDNGEYDIMKLENIIIELTTLENQKKNIDNNTTAIALGKCEDILKGTYNMLDNETLYL